MRKCLQCRKVTEELDSWWDRVRLWLFNRFHEDIIDLAQDKFTQGFGDGYKEGFKQAKERGDKIYKETVNQLTEEIEKLQKSSTEINGMTLPILNEKEVLTIEKTSTGVITRVLLGGKEVPIQLLKDLKFEAGKIESMKLWQVFQDTVKQQAYKAMFEKSETFDDLKSGKTMLYNLEVLKNIVDLLLKLQIKEKPTKS